MRLNSLVQNLKQQNKMLLVVVPIGNISIKTQIFFTMSSLFIDSFVTLACSLNPCEQRNLGSVIYIFLKPLLRSSIHVRCKICVMFPTIFQTFVKDSHLYYVLPIHVPYGIPLS
jgi:hypothetical protein